MTENINIFAFRKVVQVVQVTRVTILIDFLRGTRQLGTNFKQKSKNKTKLVLKKNLIFYFLIKGQ